jgi:osmotically-inducible protein OsmY
MPQSGGAITESGRLRTSLFDHKDDFIHRIAPVGVAAIYFGSFTLARADLPLSRQALFKLSFLYRHFLQPAGLRMTVHRHTAVLSGTVATRALLLMADILAREIEGIDLVVDETQRPAGAPEMTAATQAAESVQFLFATDQTLRAGIHISHQDNRLTLQGEVTSASQKLWAEQVAHAVTTEVTSHVRVSEAVTYSQAQPEPPAVDDESLQALIHFRLRLMRETEHVPVRIKAIHGQVTLHGKVRTDLLRQRIENVARATLGLRDLRSSLTVG